MVAPGLALANSVGKPGRDSGKVNPPNNVYFDDQMKRSMTSYFRRDVRPTPGSGKLPPVGNTVDVEKTTYTDGGSQPSAVWTDPDFDPSQPVVYYVRLLEAPTPRWSTHDPARIGVSIPDAVPTCIQGRAGSSPIWYTPTPQVATK